MVYLDLSAIAHILLDPFCDALALLAGSLLLRKFRRLNFFLALGAFLLLAVTSLPNISDPLVGSLEKQYPDSSVLALPSAQAIVVLGGSVQSASGQHPASHIIDQ